MDLSPDLSLHLFGDDDFPPSLFCWCSCSFPRGPILSLDDFDADFGNNPSVAQLCLPSKFNSPASKGLNRGGGGGGGR